MNPVASSDSAVSSSAETMVIHFFVELTIILLVSRIVSWAAQRYLGQTKSVGEILAGIALGPSVFGFIFPDVFNSFFNRDVAIVFTAISQLGLLLLMFHMGLEFDISSEFERSKKTIITVSILGITLPFILGVATAGWFWRRIDGSQPDLISFSLFLGVAMSITAIPILGRIFMELGLEKTRIAAITIGAAAIDDMIGWIMLGIVSTLASSSFAISPFLGKVFFLGGYIFLIIAIIGPYLRNRIDAHIRSNEGLNAQLLSSLVISLMISALVTSMLGVFAISGGIILGVSLQKSTHLLGEWKKKVAPFVYSVLLPVFFTNTGLRTCDSPQLSQ